jgi:hypothetical protein
VFPTNATITGVLMNERQAPSPEPSKPVDPNPDVASSKAQGNLSSEDMANQKDDAIDDLAKKIKTYPQPSSKKEDD